MNFNSIVQLHKQGKVSDVVMGYCIDKAMGSRRYNYDKMCAIKHPNVTSAHIDKALIAEQGDVRERAIKHPNATIQHISKALKDISFWVRMAAIGHQNATAEHIDKAQKDGNDWVRKTAMRIKKERNL